MLFYVPLQAVELLKVLLATYRWVGGPHKSTVVSMSVLFLMSLENTSKVRKMDFTIIIALRCFWEMGYCTEYYMVRQKTLESH